MSPQWIRACGTSSCIEVLGGPADRVLIRNSHLSQVYTVHSRAEWEAFVKAVKNGEFDGVFEEGGW